VLGRLARRAPVAVAAILLALVGGTAFAAVTYPGPVDDYASYEPQKDCRKKPMKGTKQLGAWIDATFAGGDAAVYVRACNSGGTSEHKDGRAIDWMMDAQKRADRLEVRRFLSMLFATDTDGEPHALARRMGVMYIIWNDHIYRGYGEFAKGDYRPCAKPSNCSKTARHRDHVHISLSKAGGRAATTWYNRTT